MWRRKNRPIWPGNATVPDAVRYLASACDGAVRRDGHGFSSDHVQAGHWLAALPDPEWGPAQRHAGEQLVRIYRHQLQRAGFDPDAILTNRRPRRIRPAELQRLTAGWAPDPTGLHQWRWWNGARWTAAVTTAPKAAVSN